MKKQRRFSWICATCILNGFERMADIGIFNKVQNKTETTKWKHGFSKVKLFI